MNTEEAHARCNKRNRPDDCYRFDPTGTEHLPAGPPLLAAVLPGVVGSTMTSRQSAATATETNCTSSQLSIKRYRTDSIPDLKQDQTSLVETLSAQTSSNGNTNTHCCSSSRPHGDHLNRISNSAVINTNIETRVITPSPTKRISVIFSLEALPGSIGMKGRLDDIGVKVTEIFASSQLFGKVEIGDWLISVDGIKLYNNSSINQFLHYLMKNSDARKVFQIKRTAIFPLLSELDVLAHTGEKAKQKSLTAPVYSQDRYRKHSNEDFTEKISTNFRMNAAHEAIIGFTPGEEIITESCQPMETREFMPMQKVRCENVHVAEAQALLSGVEADISNCVTGVQAVEPPVPPSIKSSKQKGKRKITFDQRIGELTRLKEKYGHCDLNSSSKGNKSLGLWSTNMRYAHKGKRTGKLTDDRIRRLEKLGFKWILQKAKTKNTAVIDQERNSNSGEHILLASDCSCDMHSDLDDSKVEQLVEVSLEHAVNPSTDADGLADVQAAEPPVSSSIKTSKQFSPGSPAFDPSRYTFEELQDSMEESKRVCREMQRRETARLDEIANRLFQSDDDESENNSDDDYTDGLDENEEYIEL